MPSISIARGVFIEPIKDTGDIIISGSLILRRKKGNPSNKRQYQGKNKLGMGWEDGFSRLRFSPHCRESGCSPLGGRGIGQVALGQS